jgi:hypothetical protein
MTLRQGDVFVIASDRASGTPRTARPPARPSEAYEVWTGDNWSPTKTDAIGFGTVAAADEYLRANLTKLLA